VLPFTPVDCKWLRCLTWLHKNTEFINCFLLVSDILLFGRGLMMICSEMMCSSIQRNKKWKFWQIIVNRLGRHFEQCITGKTGRNFSVHSYPGRLQYLHIITNEHWIYKLFPVSDLLFYGRGWMMTMFWNMCSSI